MEPYFTTDLGTVYYGENLQVMRIFKENSFDLLLTDPPYGIDKMTYRKNKSRSKLAKAKDYGEYTWDKKIPEKIYFDKMLKISKNQIIFGGNYFIEYLKNSSCWIIWDKLNGNSDFADCELAWTSFNTAVRKFDYRWHGMIQEQGNKSKCEKRYHPNQKPIPLFVGIINKYSKPSDTIIDPYAGSGVTGVACERLGRKYVLVEGELEHCETIKERLLTEIEKGKLFK